MKKTTKRWLTLATGILFAGVLTSAVACGAEANNPADKTAGVTGSVLFLQDGVPGRKFGGNGDVCFVASTGTIYHKAGTEWQETAFEKYAVEGEKLSVTYPDGTIGTYELVSSQAAKDGACAHTSFGETVAIYEPHCVLPGIGVKTCTDCHESFVEIISADPEKHNFNGENYGRCDYCGQVESGVVGYEATTSEQLANLFSEDKLQNGDTIVLREKMNLKPDEQLDVGEKDITIDVRGNEFNVEKKEGVTGYGANLNVNAGGSLTITDSSAENAGAINVTIPKGAGNYTVDGHRSGYFLQANGTEENRAVLNFENVQINIDDKNRMNVVMTADYADVTLGKGTELNVEGTEYSVAMYVNDGTNLTIDGAEINTKGDVTPFVVGSFGEAATLNFESGKINMDSPSDRMFGIQVNGAGHVNMTGGEINITGDLRSQINGADVAVAIGVDNRVGADWIDPTNPGLGYKWICVDASIDITGGTINLAPTYGTAYGIVSWPGNPVINVSGMTIICDAPESEDKIDGCAFALCCAELDGTVSPHMYLGDELDIRLMPTGRNLFFSTRENGGDGLAPDWEASGKFIFDKSTDKIFGESNKEKYGGQFVRPYEE